MTIFVLAAACVLCACGAAKPEETVDKYCEAMQECNYEELSQYVAHDATRDRKNLQMKAAEKQTVRPQAAIQRMKLIMGVFSGTASRIHLQRIIRR